MQEKQTVFENKLLLYKSVMRPLAAYTSVACATPETSIYNAYKYYNISFEKGDGRPWFVRNSQLNKV
jgi:hypothetical protein